MSIRELLQSGSSTQATQTASDGSIPLTLGINVVIFVVGMAIYQFIRPRLPLFYYPRLYTGERIGFFSWENWNWPIRSLIANPETVMKKSGMQGVLYSRFQLFMLVYIVIMAITSCPILLPINILGGNVGSSSFLVTTATNIQSRSNDLIAHLVLTVIFVALAMFFILWYQQIYFRSRRKLQRLEFVNSNTVFIYGISKRANHGELFQFLSTLYPGKLAATFIAHDADKLLKLKKKKHRAIDMIARSEAVLFEKDKRKRYRPGTCGFLATCLHLRSKVDAIDHFKQQLVYTSAKISRTQKTEFRGSGAAFATFFSPIDVHYCLNDFHTIRDRRRVIAAFDDPGLCKRLDVAGWQVSPAMQPVEYYWDKLAISHSSQRVRQLIIGGCLLAFALLYSIPISFMASLDSMSLLPGFGVVVRNTVFINPVVGDLFQGYVPTLLTTLVLAILPPLLDVVCKLEGPHNTSEHHTSVMRQYYIFLMFNVLIFPALLIGVINGLMQLTVKGGTISISQIDFSLQGSFFINWLIQQTLMGATFRILRIPDFLIRLVLIKLAVSEKEREKARHYVDEMLFRIRFAQMLLVVAVVQVFAVAVPLILPIGVLYFVIMYVIDKNNMLHVFPKDFNNRDMAPNVINQFLAGLLVYEIAMIIFFFIKQYLAGLIISIILVFFTLLFGFLLMLLSEWDKYSYVRYFKPDLQEWDYPESLLETAYCHPGFVLEEEDLEEKVNRHLESIQDHRTDIKDHLFANAYEMEEVRWKEEAGSSTVQHSKTEVETEDVDEVEAEEARGSGQV